MLTIKASYAYCSQCKCLRALIRYYYHIGYLFKVCSIRICVSQVRREARRCLSDVAGILVQPCRLSRCLSTDACNLVLPWGQVHFFFLFVWQPPPCWEVACGVHSQNDHFAATLANHDQSPFSDPSSVLSPPRHPSSVLPAQPSPAQPPSMFNVQPTVRTRQSLFCFVFFLPQSSRTTYTD